MHLSSEYNFKLFLVESGDDLNNTILIHLARSGHIQITQEFKLETGLDDNDDLLEKFSIMNEIDQGLKQGKLEPAIAWARQKKKEL